MPVLNVSGTVVVNVALGFACLRQGGWWGLWWWCVLLGVGVGVVVDMVVITTIMVLMITYSV